MDIQQIRALRGPNVYHHRPVLVVRLDLGDLTGVASRDVEGFTHRLTEALPGLYAHHCSRGHVGGFVERLYEGTYFAHITEHVALELSELAGVGVTFGQARSAGDGQGQEGLYDVILRYRNEAGMRHVVRVAVDLVEALVRNETFPLAEAIEAVRETACRAELGLSTRAIVRAAERRGIPWERVGEENLIRFGYGRHSRLVRAAMTDATSAIGVDAARYKDLTKDLLRNALVPVPDGVVVWDEAAAVAALDTLRSPIVVKPRDGNQGRGVTVGAATPEEVRRAFALAAAYGPSVIVEEQLVGKDYRLLIVGGHLVAASERSPCHVVGDGARTIAELIEHANADPRRGEGHEKPLTRIVVDDAVLARLAKGGWSLAAVPAAGERVLLRGSANLSTGGTARDVTDEVHPDVRAVCERAARAVGLDVCGVDLIAEDVTRPLRSGRAGIVEVNAAPGLRMHLHPSEGTPRDVGSAIVAQLYPPGAPARIPIISVTGTNGKTTVTRLIGHVLRVTGVTVGMTTTGGVWVGGECVARGDTTGPASARSVLADPTVEAAVLETARGGILRRGLGYDWADVAVVTNVRADHLGQDGITSIEDVIHVKSLVAERVREGGALVVNADDPGALRLLARPGVQRRAHRLLLFSQRPCNAEVLRHCADGGTAYFVRDGWIVEARGSEEEGVVPVEAVPITYGGLATFNVANTLAAVAACRAHGVLRSTIARALARFDSNADNSGRANVYRLGAGYVMIDYGHNPDAFLEIGAFLRRWQPGRLLIGVVNAPGDRTDALVRAAGRAAAEAFTHLVLSEDKDLRGRAPGEVVALLQQGAAEAPPVPVEVVYDEVEALRSVLDRVRAGAVAVTFYEHLEPLIDLLATAGAEPVTVVPLLAEGDAIPSPHAAVVRPAVWGADAEAVALTTSPEARGYGAG